MYKIRYRYVVFFFTKLKKVFTFILPYIPCLSHVTAFLSLDNDVLVYIYISFETTNNKSFQVFNKRALVYPLFYHYALRLRTRMQYATSCYLEKENYSSLRHTE